LENCAPRRVTGTVPPQLPSRASLELTARARCSQIRLERHKIARAHTAFRCPPAKALWLLEVFGFVFRRPSVKVYQRSPTEAIVRSRQGRAARSRPGSSRPDRRRFFAALFLEEQVVSGVGVEGRVEVDQVNGCDRHLTPQNVQVIAEAELVVPVH